jgi:FkbM family methyltransferase
MEIATRTSRKAILYSLRLLKPVVRLLLILPLRCYFRYIRSPYGKDILWKYLASHLWWFETHVEARTLFGNTLFVDAGEIIGRYIYYFGLWEPNVTNWICERLCPGDVFIDVGANVGYYSLLASQLVGDSGRVIAIEPLSELFHVLTQNLWRNNVRNVRTVNVAAWDVEDEVAIFTWPARPPGYTSVMPLWAKAWNLERHGQVHAKPLSTILQAGEMKAARIIKIDVEGAEWHVLSGMKSILSGGREDLELIVELTPSVLLSEGIRWRDVLSFFQAWGFNAYKIENSYLAEAYFHRSASSRPVRIEPTSMNAEDQMDVIFSRVDAAAL